MDEQDIFIVVLKNLHMAVDFFNAGASYTPYVPFVLRLTQTQINAISLVRFLLLCHWSIFFRNAFLLSILHC